MGCLGYSRYLEKTLSVLVKLKEFSKRIKWSTNFFLQICGCKHFGYLMYCRYFKASWVLASLARDAEGALTAAKLHESYFNLVLKFVTSLKIQLKSNRGICPPCAICLVFLRCRANSEEEEKFRQKNEKLKRVFFEKFLGMNKHWSAGGWVSLTLRPSALYSCSNTLPFLIWQNLNIFISILFYLNIGITRCWEIFKNKLKNWTTEYFHL